MIFLRKPFESEEQSKNYFLTKEEIMKIDPNYKNDSFNYSIENGIGYINCSGEVFYEEIYAYFFYGFAPSQIKRIIENLNSNKKVKEIVLKFDTPGGDSRGVGELAEFINQNKKPIHADIINDCCSAGYWLASACKTIKMSKWGVTGSIGCFCQFWNDGDNLITVTAESSPLKVPTKENEYHSARKLVNQIGNDFISAVAKFKNLERDYVRDNFGRGAVMTYSEALAVGMIDNLEPKKKYNQKNIKKFNKKLDTKSNVCHKYKSKGDNMNILEKMKSKNQSALHLVDDETVDIGENSLATYEEMNTLEWVRDNLPDAYQAIIDEQSEGDSSGDSSQGDTSQGDTKSEGDQVKNLQKIVSFNPLNKVEEEMKSKAIKENTKYSDFQFEVNDYRFQNPQTASYLKSKTESDINTIEDKAKPYNVLVKEKLEKKLKSKKTISVGA